MKDMKIKKPSLKDAGNKGLYAHLGHFAKDCYIEQGHNDVPGNSVSPFGAKEYPKDKISDYSSSDTRKDKQNAENQKAMDAAIEGQKDLDSLMVPGEKLRNR